MKRILIALILILALLLSSCGEAGDGTGGAVPDPGCTSHADADENGRCDICSVSLLVPIDFYAVNDFHGKLFDSDGQAGADELTTYVKTVGAADEYYVVLSSGDMWQGSAESGSTRGAIVTEWMNSLGFVSMTLGNHEYDWGEDVIESNAEIAEFPLLAINVFDKDTHTRVEYAEASVMVERGGVSIGIIGAMGDCYSSIMSSMVEDVYFKTGSELTALVKQEAQRLRSEGADVVIYSLHDGLGSNAYNNKSVPDSEISSYYDISLSEHVDLVFEGHTHRSYVMRDSRGVYHAQGGGDNDGIIHAELKVNTVTGKTRVTEVNFVSDNVYSDLSDDPIIGELSEKYESVLGWMSDVLGTNAYNRSGNFMRSLVARLYYEFGEEVFGEDYDIALGGGYLSVRSPGYLAAGEVTYSDLSLLFPFDNRLVLCSVSGRDLNERFFETTNSNYYIAYGEYGESIKGKVDTGATYYIVVDTYTASYAPNRLTTVAEYPLDVFARDLLAEYVRGGGLSK